MTGDPALDRPQPGVDDVWHRNDSLAHREVAGETILVPVRGHLAELQRLFVLSPVAAFIWEQLDGEQTVEAIHRRVLEAFAVDGAEAEADLLDLLAELEKAELIGIRQP